MFLRPHHKHRFRQTCADLMGPAAPSTGAGVPGPQEGSPSVPPSLALSASKPGKRPQPHSARQAEPKSVWLLCPQAPLSARSVGRPRARFPPPSRPASPPAPPTGPPHPSAVGLRRGLRECWLRGRGWGGADKPRALTPAPCCRPGLPWLRGGGHGPLPVPLLQLPPLPGLLASAPPGWQWGPGDTSNSCPHPGRPECRGAVWVAGSGQHSCVSTGF